jgi:hypothetical protein
MQVHSTHAKSKVRIARHPPLGMEIMVELAEIAGFPGSS